MIIPHQTTKMSNEQYVLQSSQSEQQLKSQGLLRKQQPTLRGSSSDEHFQFLKSLPQPEQRTPEWFEARKGRLTASLIAPVLPKTEELLSFYLAEFPDNNEDVPDPTTTCSPYDTFKSAMRQKIGLDKFTWSVATLWGQKYETPIQMWYDYSKQVKTHEFGLIQHQSIKFLAASPDGITEDCICIEIKCPKSRLIKKYPPFYYWIQTQIQMEVLDLDECDFIEARIEEFYSYEELLLALKDSGNEQSENEQSENERNEIAHGLLMEHRSPPYMLNDIKYSFAPMGLSVSEQTKWIESNLSESKNVIDIPVFWIAKVFQITRIKRSKEWFTAALPHLQKASAALEYYQEHPDALDTMTLEEVLLQ